MSVVYKINGREMSKAEFNAYEFTPPTGYKRNGAPMVTRTYRHAQKLVSESVAVHPLDRVEAEEHAARTGVPTHFHELGQPEFNSMVHRDKYLKTIGYHVRGRQKYRSKPERTKTVKKLLLGGE